MTTKSSISLTNEQHAFAKSLVDTGLFPSLSAVLQHSVELLRQRIEDEDHERRALAELLTLRRAGPFVSSANMDERLRDMIESKRRDQEIIR